MVFLALIWMCFPEYQKLCHLLSLASVVRFNVESTDSLVLYTLNRGLLQERDFYCRKDRPGCFLSNEARRKYIGIFESRMWQESRDGCTGRTLNFRRQIEKQVKIMQEVIAGTRMQYDPYKLPI